MIVEQQGLVNFAKTTEKDSMWAGGPRDPAIVGLGLYAGRKTLFSFETAIPWWTPDVFKRLVQPRIEGLQILIETGNNNVGVDYLVQRRLTCDPWLYMPYTMDPRAASKFKGGVVVYSDDFYNVRRLSK